MEASDHLGQVLIESSSKNIRKSGNMCKFLSLAAQRKRIIGLVLVLTVMIFMFPFVIAQLLANIGGLQLARTMVRKEKTESAEVFLLYGIALGAKHSYLNLGKLYLFQGRADKAAEALANAPSTKVNNPVALFVRGQIYAALNDPYTAGMAWDAANTEKYFRLKGDWKNLEILYRYQIQKSPDSFRTNSSLGYVLIRLGRCQEALPLLEKAVGYAGLQGITDKTSLIPGRYSLLVSMGDCQLELNDGAQARQWYDEAIGLEPSTSQAYVSLGHLFILQRDGAAALDVLNRAVGLEPTDAQAHFYLSVVYLDLLNQPCPAVQSVEKAIASLPKDQLGTSSYMFAELGNAWLAAGSPQKAIDSYRRGLEIAPQDRSLKSALQNAEQLLSGSKDECR